MYNIIAVISDIHSNRFALEAVLRDLDNLKADLIINLGDSLFGPLDPLATAELLMQRPDIINIMGNCDEQPLEETGTSLTYRYVKPLLREQEESWIRSHRGTWSYDGLLFCHGTPWSNTEYLLEELTPAAGPIYKPAEQLAAELHRIEERIVFCGHSHVFHLLELPEGKQAVNPGSVGLPAYEEELPYAYVMKSGTPLASYCLCIRDNGSPGGWCIDHRLVEYDWDKAADLAEEAGRPDYAVAIRYGRMTGESTDTRGM